MQGPARAACIGDQYCPEEEGLTVGSPVAIGSCQVQRRSDFDTIYEILRVCIIGAGKTRILCRANLNHRQLTKYLTALLEYGLLDVEENEFRMTPKGRFFMEKFGELLELLDEWSNIIPRRGSAASV